MLQQIHVKIRLGFIWICVNGWALNLYREADKNVQNNRDSIIPHVEFTILNTFVFRPDDNSVSVFGQLIKSCKFAAINKYDVILIS